MKRADHLLFVSLKYTRTVDVIKSFVERLINAMGKAVDCLLMLAKERGLLSEVPANTMQKCAILKEVFPEGNVAELVDFYLLLRQINRAEFTRSREYRRHVTMHAMLPNGPLEVNIDLAREYFDKAQRIISFVSEAVEGKKE